MYFQQVARIYSVLLQVICAYLCSRPVVLSERNLQGEAASGHRCGSRRPCCGVTPTHTRRTAALGCGYPRYDHHDGWISSQGSSPENDFVRRLLTVTTYGWIGVGQDAASALRDGLRCGHLWLYSWAEAFGDNRAKAKEACVN